MGIRTGSEAVHHREKEDEEEVARDLKVLSIEMSEVKELIRTNNQKIDEHTALINKAVTTLVQTSLSLMMGVQTVEANRIRLEEILKRFEEQRLNDRLTEIEKVLKERGILTTVISSSSGG